MTCNRYMKWVFLQDCADYLYLILYYHQAKVFWEAPLLSKQRGTTSFPEDLLLVENCQVRPFHWVLHNLLPATMTQFATMAGQMYYYNRVAHSLEFGTTSNALLFEGSCEDILGRFYLLTKFYFVPSFFCCVLSLGRWLARWKGYTVG